MRVHRTGAPPRPAARRETAQRRIIPRNMRGAHLFVPDQPRRLRGEPLGGAFAAQQLAHDRPFEQQVDEIDLAHPHHPVEQRLGQRVQAIADDHRQPRHRQFQRHRTRRGDCRTARGKGVVSVLRAEHDDRVAGPDAGSLGHHIRDRRHRRHDDAKSADQCLETCQRRAKYRQQPLHLAAATARQHRDQRLIGADPICRAKSDAVAAIGAAVEHRMADIGTGEPDLLEIRRLKRQQRHQMVVPAGHAPRPPGAPRPHHRRHVVDQWQGFA
jgi:hypothetical protein